LHKGRVNEPLTIAAISAVLPQLQGFAANRPRRAQLPQAHFSPQGCDLPPIVAKHSHKEETDSY